MEYDEANDETNYVVVEHYKVETVISNDNHGTFPSNHIHVSNLGYPGDIRYVGIQPGMDVTITTNYNGNVITINGTVSKIEDDDSATWNGWRVYLDFPDGYNQQAADGIQAGDAAVFKLPHNKRALGFSHFASKKPKKLITGINILDNLLFWTDGLTEPKKINIDRCKYGSQQISPTTYPNGTSLFNTLLVVNGQLPDNTTNARVGGYNSNISYLPLTYREATVIRKSPTSPLVLTMSNVTRPAGETDLAPIDGSTVVSSDITLPTNASGTSDFFFGTNGIQLPVGNTTPWLTFPYSIDWMIGDIIEFSPHDDEAGFNQEPLVILEITDIDQMRTSFEFEVRSMSDILQKPFIHFRASLQRKDPLFEFKFPRFAYRWKYEDGEYSCFSPFSEIAFLPEEFDYFPKKGYNLGMTNNLRYLLLSGFKPKTTPLDVVEIDVLYKESNSPNVYTVETIKSPSSKIESLGTSDFDGDIGWFGRVKHSNPYQSASVNPEMPNTLETNLHMTTWTTLTGLVQMVSGIARYELNAANGQSDIMIGDSVTLVNFAYSSSGGVSPIIGTVANIYYTNDPTTGDPETWVTIVDSSGSPIMTSIGGNIYFWREIAQKPAIYIDDPQGSLQIETDMIHATLPANQLLRPWDNVPRSALAQEVTGNRVVYGNYIQNYDLKNHDTNEIVKPEFGVRLSGRRNIRDNVQYDNRTALRHPSTGVAINWYDSLNALIPILRVPERSIKSIRDYQMG